MGANRSGRTADPGLALLLGLAMLVVAACTPGRSAEDATGGADDGVVTLDPTTTQPAPLGVEPVVDVVPCDDVTRAAVRLTGAEPGELIEITSDVPIEPAGGLADGTGTFVVAWTCGPAEAQLRWPLTATGLTSGRTAAFTLTGAAEDPDAGFAIQLAEDPFICDGSTRALGMIRGADPGEMIIFKTRQGTADVNPRNADGNGQVELRWSCRPDEDGTVWIYELSGTESRRTGTLTITGARPDTIAPLTITLTEDPFVCDGGAREFAMVTGLLPNEVVRFTAPGVTDLIDGRADASGALPIRWQCGAGDIDKRWELTATGAESGRSGTVAFGGGSPAPGSSPALTATVTEDPFVCDGASRVFATLAGLEAHEFVDFASPQADGLREGRADASGMLPIRWRCDSADASKTWDLTATGRSSGRTVTVTITGG